MEMIYESALDYKVIEASVNNLLPCAQFSIVRPLTARYRAFDDGTIQGAGLTVKCVKKAPENYAMTLGFGIPTHRKGGSPLLFNEISHYVLKYNDKTVIIPKDQTTYTINGLSLETIFTLWVVDTDGLISKTVTVEG